MQDSTKKQTATVGAKARTAQAPVPSPSPSPSKIDTVIALVSRPGGAKLEELMQATGWLRHSVRGALSGSLKRKRGLNVVSEKVDGARVYRLAEVRT